jgi:hypothetical protein
LENRFMALVVGSKSRTLSEDGNFCIIQLLGGGLLLLFSPIQLWACRRPSSVTCHLASAKIILFVHPAVCAIAINIDVVHAVVPCGRIVDMIY